jgi:hypothetical protein
VIDRRVLASACLVLVVAVAYAPTLDNYFVQDDFGVVWLLSRAPADAFSGWFVTSWMDNIWGYTPDEIRPFVAVTYQVAARFGAGSPVLNHVINVAFHAGTALLVFATALTGAGVGIAAATCAAALFAVLPNQSETVAWITGRVDSMPAFFYLAAFLAYAGWRRRGARHLYMWSIVWCFVALFSKQNAITLVPALVLYDVIVIRTPLEASWAAVRPYAPHALLTAGYLVLRYELFGEVAREGLLTPERIGFFASDASHHVMRVVTGNESGTGAGLWAVVVAATLLAGGVLISPRATRGWSDSLRSAVYFAFAWTLLGFAPTLVSTYASPRHAYLASVGWALFVGVAFDFVWKTGTRLHRSLAVAAAAVLLVEYSIELRASVLDWDRRAAISAKAVAELEREAMAAPAGTLILAGAPARSWAFALPFAMRSPFTPLDLDGRVAIVSHSLLHCCPADQWEAYTRRQLRAWLDRPDRPPVIVMFWDPATGRLRRLSDHDDASLRVLMAQLLATGDRAALDNTIARIVGDFVAFHGAARE